MSALTPRELVYRTLRFEPTPRVPRQLWALPWARQHYPDELAAIQRDFPEDIGEPTFEFPQLPHMQGKPTAIGTCVDEWGCVFTNIQEGIIGEVKTPLVQSYESDLDKVRPPDAWIGQVAGVNEACEQSDRFMIFGPHVNPFERLQYIRGSENVFMDLMDQPAGVFELLDRIHSWNLAMIDTWVKTDVDAIAFADDWGAQRSLLIRPAMWREIFKPMYQEYISQIHKAGKFVFMHSDGHIFDIYEDLIEIGVNAINSQLFCMDIEEIGRRFKGRICFWGEIDRQHILPHGATDDVRKAVQSVAHALYDGSGGVIAQCEFGPGAKPDNVRSVFDEWNHIGNKQSTEC